jgi:hypothetical protein
LPRSADASAYWSVSAKRGFLYVQAGQGNVGFFACRSKITKLLIFVYFMAIFSKF